VLRISCGRRRNKLQEGLVEKRGLHQKKGGGLSLYREEKMFLTSLHWRGLKEEGTHNTERKRKKKRREGTGARN